MMRQVHGVLDGKGMRVGIAAARFNSHVVELLVEGALDGLRRHGVVEDDITVVRVPGSWEIPLICKRLAETGRFDAVIALGAVIRGSTPHFDYVAGECAKGVAQVGLQCDLPVIFGVLTTDTVEQAMDRAGLKSGNRGFDAALNAIEMVQALRLL